MEVLLKAGREYGWAAVALCAVAYALWKTREHWLPWLGIRARIAQKGAESRLSFENRLRERILDDNAAMVEWFRKRLEELWQELKAQMQKVAALQVGTVEASKEFTETMILVSEVLREQVNTLTEIRDVIDESRKTNAAVWFVLTKLYHYKGGDADEVIPEGQVADK